MTGRTRTETRRKNNGLSDFGKSREMNRLGMLVDISHVSAAVMADVLGYHTADYRIPRPAALPLNHTRNVPDNILKELRRTAAW